MGTETNPAPAQGGKAEKKPVEQPPVKQKPVEQELPEIDKTIEEIRRDKMALKRIILTCNDPQMKDWESTPYIHVSNAVFNFPKVTVPFGVEWHVPQMYVELLKEQKCTIPIKTKDDQGRPITVPKEIQKYNVSELPPLSKKELEELRTAQAMRDGISKE
ncbi:MAG: hypothetical protein LGB73_01545 [Sulfurovum sp.]|nr:hypothetical protein [Sulfurovum sp.]